MLKKFMEARWPIPMPEMINTVRGPQYVYISGVLGDRWGVGWAPWGWWGSCGRGSRAAGVAVAGRGVRSLVSAASAGAVGAPWPVVRCAARP
jgi:hypothetical protein